MLLYSTILNVKETLDPNSFLKLIKTWNLGSQHKDTIVPGLENWNYERNIRFGNSELWMDIQEYPKEKIIAVRYENRDEDGIIWGTDIVMNYGLMKISIRLDRCCDSDVIDVNPKFSPPYLITLLIKKGYLENDGDLPVQLEPVEITEENAHLVADIVNGRSRYELPVVYVSKTYLDRDPLKVSKLAGKLKGVAHVLVQKDRDSSEYLRKQCSENNEYNGAVGIYYPNSDRNHRRFLYKTGKQNEYILFNNIVHAVTHYLNLRNVDPLFTWRGVNNALLRDKISSQREERLKIEKAKAAADEAVNAEIKNLSKERQKAVEESNKENDRLLDRCDKEIESLNDKIEELTDIINKLKIDNQRLEVQIKEQNGIPLLYLGEELEVYDGEIKDLILSVLDDSLKDIKKEPRKLEIIKDIIESNGYEKLGEARSNELERILKGYRNMTKTVKRDLEKLGFEVRTDGTHYKAYYNDDDRYIITLSSTSGDHRAGKNTISEAKNLIF